MCKECSRRGDLSSVKGVRHSRGVKKPPDIVDVHDVALMLGVKRQRVDQLARDHPDFPTPYVLGGGVRYWWRSSIVDWARKAERRFTERPAVGSPAQPG
jgi:predicted DNA-binding transcriptional regulator AlpA